MIIEDQSGFHTELWYSHAEFCQRNVNADGAGNANNSGSREGLKRAVREIAATFDRRDDETELESGSRI